MKNKLFYIIFIVCLFFIFMFLSSNILYSRTVRSVVLDKTYSISHEERVAIITSDNTKSESVIFVETFPDGELCIQIDKPEKIVGASIDFSHVFKSVDDYVEMLLILGTLKQYKAKNISLTIENWQWDISSAEDRYLLQILRMFADEIKIKHQVKGEEETAIGLSFPPEFNKKKTPFYVEKVACIQERFEQEADNAVNQLKRVSAMKINVGKNDGLHWKVDVPEDLTQEDDIVLIHSTENSENLVELLLTLFALREQGVESISLINTYQGYARQDKEFKSGQGISAHVMLTVLNHFLDNNFPINVHYGNNSGVTWLSNRDISFVEEDSKNEVCIQTLDALKVRNLNGFVQLAENGINEIINRMGEEKFIDYIKKYPLILIGPDKGSFPYVEEAAEVVQERLQKRFEDLQGKNVVISGYLKKKRLSPTDTEIEEVEILGKDDKPLPVSYNDIADYWMMILDDETSTGGTLKNAVYHLSDILGADEHKIFAGVVHGKFAYGIDRFYQVGEDEKIPEYFVVLNTLDFSDGMYDYVEEGMVQVGSITPLIAYAIKRILGQSVNLKER